MQDDLASTVRWYAANAAHLRSFEDQEEVMAMFILRDVIADRLKSQELTSEYQEKLAQADAIVADLRYWLVGTHPDVFHPDRKTTVPHEHWWWYLDEGPQVRAKALEAA